MTQVLDIDIEKIHVIIEKYEPDNFDYICHKRSWHGFVLFTKGSGIYINRHKQEMGFSKGTLLLLNKNDRYEIHSKGPCSYIASGIDLAANNEQEIILPELIKCNEKHESQIRELCKIWQSHTTEAYMLCKIGLLKLYLELYKN